jgi:hypothetical protein
MRSGADEEGEERKRRRPKIHGVSEPAENFFGMWASGGAVLDMV